MKNMKVSKKLIVSFLITVLLTAIVGVVGIVGMKQIDDADTDMFENQAMPMAYMGDIIEALQRMRTNMREYILAVALHDTSLIDTAKRNVDDNILIMDKYLDPYYATISSDEIRTLFNEARNIYQTKFLKCMSDLYDQAKSGTDPRVMYDTMNTYLEVNNQMVDAFSKCFDINEANVGITSESNQSTANMLMTIMVFVMLVSMVTAVFLAFYISGLISKPLAPLTSFLNNAKKTGNITLRPEDVRVISKYAERKDEIGQVIASTADFIARMVETGENLEKVAQGDLTCDIAMLSEEDTMGCSLSKMVGNLNDMFGGIKESAIQVSSGSKQIADGAQSLAQGSTQQASSIEELSATVRQIAEQTNENASIARESAKLSSQIKENAEKGTQQMEQMMQSVREINEASGEIGKVIKVIDDIAFQTNILALNAAVEAARAGQHGKGFAVVAEEVRNLAGKSAEAAKNTSSLIENSISKANLGMQIATETSNSLNEMVDGINRSAEIVSQIAFSSDEQANSIAQVHSGIDQVAEVIQLNSATAEESAAASEEMNSQSGMLTQMTSRFRLKDLGGFVAIEPAHVGGGFAPATSGKAGFGKY